jgi:carboxyl-terminal processing protease
MMRKTKIALGATAALVALAAGTTMVNLTRSPSAVAANAEIYRQLDLFGDVLERVRTDYVEKPDDQKLIESAINGMLAALDPHSAYLNVKHFRDMQVQTRGEFGGLGIEVTMENGVVKVVAPIEDTPAQRAGVMSGDLITHLDNEQILGLTLQEAVEKMRGPVNSPIELTVVRKNVEEPVKIKLTRDIIRINPVKASVEGGDIGYIRMTTFNEQTYNALKDGIEQLEKDAGPKLRGYVLDLRNNPGGLLDQAIAVSDAFLDKGAIVITRGRNMEETQRSNARAGDLASGRKIVVLLNGGSASASEIVAGALQDHHRATIIGTRSFGKGSVQTIIPLGTNGAIRLTTARYYTPAGRSIQAKGIEPNIVVEQELPEEMKAKMSEPPRGEASLRGHLLSEDGKEAEESGSNSYVPPEKEKDTQLIYAMDILRGIKAAETGTVKPSENTDEAAAKQPVPN